MRAQHCFPLCCSVTPGAGQKLPNPSTSLGQGLETDSGGCWQGVWGQGRLKRDRGSRDLGQTQDKPKTKPLLQLHLMLVRALEHSEKGTSSSKGSEGTHQAPCPVPIRAVPTQKRFGVGGAPLLAKLTPQGKPQCGARNGYRLQPSPVAWRLGWEGISHQHDLQSALTLPSTSPEGCCRLAPSLCLPTARGWQPA